MCIRDRLSPLFPLVMPSVQDLWTYGETGFHSLCAAVVQERYGREALVSAFRILGEGQLSLTKFLILTDTPQDLKNFPKLLEHVLERFKPETDLFVISNVSMDTLDYTSGKVNEGSKAIMPVSYTHLRAHETPEHLVCRLLLEKKKKKNNKSVS